MTVSCCVCCACDLCFVTVTVSHRSSTDYRPPPDSNKALSSKIKVKDKEHRLCTEHTRLLLQRLSTLHAPSGCQPGISAGLAGGAKVDQRTYRHTVSHATPPPWSRSAARCSYKGHLPHVPHLSTHDSAPALWATRSKTPSRVRIVAPLLRVVVVVVVRRVVPCSKEGAR